MSAPETVDAAATDRDTAPGLVGSQVFDAARDQEFTGVLVVDADEDVRLYFERGAMYFAERSTDRALARRLVDLGAITGEQLAAGAAQSCDGVVDLGVVVDRVPGIDRRRLVDAVARLRDEVAASIADRPIIDVQAVAHQHHPSGVNRWFAASPDGLGPTSGPAPAGPPPPPTSSTSSTPAPPPPAAPRAASPLPDPPTAPAPISSPPSVAEVPPMPPPAPIVDAPVEPSITVVPPPPPPAPPGGSRRPGSAIDDPSPEPTLADRLAMPSRFNADDAVISWNEPSWLDGVDTDLASGRRPSVDRDAVDPTPLARRTVPGERRSDRGLGISSEWSASLGISIEPSSPDLPAPTDVRTAPPPGDDEPPAPPGGVSVALPHPTEPATVERDLDAPRADASAPDGVSGGACESVAETGLMSGPACDPVSVSSPEADLDPAVESATPDRDLDAPRADASASGGVPESVAEPAPMSAPTCDSVSVPAPELDLEPAAGLDASRADASAPDGVSGGACESVAEAGLMSAPACDLVSVPSPEAESDPAVEPAVVERDLVVPRADASAPDGVSGGACESVAETGLMSGPACDPLSVPASVPSPELDLGPAVEPAVVERDLVVPRADASAPDGVSGDLAETVAHPAPMPAPDPERGPTTAPADELPAPSIEVVWPSGEIDPRRDAAIEPPVAASRDRSGATARVAAGRTSDPPVASPIDGVPDVGSVDFVEPDGDSVVIEIDWSLGSATIAPPTAPDGDTTAVLDDVLSAVERTVADCESRVERARPKAPSLANLGGIVRTQSRSVFDEISTPNLAGVGDGRAAGTEIGVPPDDRSGALRRLIGSLRRP